MVYQSRNKQVNTIFLIIHLSSSRKIENKNITVALNEVIIKYECKILFSIESSTGFLLRERIKESRHLKNKSIGIAESCLTSLVNEEFCIQVLAANLHPPKMDYPLLLILHHSNESHQ